MIIEGIKKDCEKMAKGNNGRIRPDYLIIDRERVAIIEGEVENYSEGGHCQISFPLPRRLKIEWDSWEWRVNVGPKEAKTYYMDFVERGPDEVEGAYEIVPECTKCENRPMETSNGQYYCPVCQ